jgi:SNF2 family DNA or RNA helicase
MANITLAVKKSQFIKTAKQSLFVSFSYDMNLVATIKTLPTRYYVGASREWEVPLESVNDVMNLFSQHKITIQGKAVTELEAVEQNAPKTMPGTLFTAAESKEFQYKTKPFYHQEESFKHSLTHPKFLLGDEQGLGKTKQAIDIAVNRKKANGFKHCLIICGVNTLKSNWYREVMIHSNERPHIIGAKVDFKGNSLRIKEGTMKERLADISSDMKEFFLITNIESMRDPREWDKHLKKHKPLNATQQVQYDFICKIKELCENGTIGMVILDEAHKAKNSESKQGKALHFANAHFKLPMTGTPIMNNPIDAYNVMKWIGAERGTLYQFKNRYVVYGSFNDVVGYKNMDELRKRLDAIMLRRRKDEVLDLPPKIESTEYVQMSKDQAALYKEVLNDIKANLASIELDSNPLARLIRLRQVTSNPLIVSDVIDANAKLDRLEEIVEELMESGQKALIFSNWSEVTDAIRERLKKYNPAYITGDTKNRDAEVQKFQNDKTCGVAIGTIGAMGTGLTMTAASTVIFFDRPWNKATVDQTADRAHRIGTTGTVNVITLVCEDTIDERIEEIISDKGQISDGLVDGEASPILKLDKDAKKKLLKKLLA